MPKGIKIQTDYIFPSYKTEPGARLHGARGNKNTSKASFTNIADSDLVRLARRSGVKRINTGTYGRISAAISV